MSDEEKKVVQNTEDVFENSSVAENAIEQETSSTNSADVAPKVEIKPSEDVNEVSKVVEPPVNKLVPEERKMVSGRESVEEESNDASADQSQPNSAIGTSSVKSKTGGLCELLGH